MGLAYDEEAIARIERGVTGVMRQLGMLEGQPGASQPKWLDPTEVLRFPEDLAEKSGVFFPAVAKGTTVAKGALLGRVTDYFGKKIYEARAPFAGEVLYILGTPPVSAGEPLAFIGAPR